MCDGVFVAVLSTVAAAAPPIRTLGLTAPSMRPLKGCGTISGDTGAAHLATGYRTPSVVLFGPVPPTLWGPPPERRRHRALWAGARARPEWDGVGVHPALVDLGVAEVLAAVDEVEQAVRVDRAVAA